MYRYPCRTRFKGHLVNKRTTVLTESCNTFFFPPAVAFSCLSLSPPPSLYLPLSLILYLYLFFFLDQVPLCRHRLRPMHARNKATRARQSPCERQRSEILSGLWPVRWADLSIVMQMCLIGRASRPYVRLRARRPRDVASHRDVHAKPDH